MSKESAFEVGRLYLPIKTIADTLTAGGRDLFSSLPGLMGWWPMGVRFSNGAVADQAGTTFAMTEVGSCPVGYDGHSFSHLGNGVNYFSNTTGGGVTGTEAFITASLNGLTVGGWFMIDGLPASSGGLISKENVFPNKGYSLSVDSSGQFIFGVSFTGATTVFATSPVAPISAWRFIVGRFIPSTEVAVFVDGDKVINTTGVPASCNVSTGNFEIGRTASTDALVAHAKARDTFLCASALSDALIEELRATSVP